MAGLTIDELLKEHVIRQNKIPAATLRRWLLDGYAQPFPHKIYAAMAAVALTEAKRELSFHDLKAYALRIVAADGSENYFNRERGFSTEERTGFSAEVKEMKMRLTRSTLSATKLEAVIWSDLREIEAIGGLQLRMLVMDIKDIARLAMNHMKNRKEPPYLKPLKEADKPRTLFYEFVR